MNSIIDAKETYDSIHQIPVKINAVVTDAYNEHPISEMSVKILEAKYNQLWLEELFTDKFIQQNLPSQERMRQCI